jgi:dTMP kinase
LSSRSDRGRFIVVEGIDGAGTTTQTRRLVELFRAHGCEAAATCEPSAGPVGSLIRSALEKKLPDAEKGAPRRFDWATFALLFAADRLDHVASFVSPRLKTGAVVVSDRYTLSSLVYQSATAQDPAAALDWVRTLNREAPKPDLTLVLDVPADLAAERRLARGGHEELFDALELQHRLAAGYAKAEELCPDQRIVRVSGIGEIDVVTQRLAAQVSAAFPELLSSERA